ncbi:MAG: hypothetical protein AVO33_02095 [delta proteobacterium ML8_F1]|nr:MAG: hypothetical protein AVO33_02095 [delta proteobacterium ML8_F1]
MDRRFRDLSLVDLGEDYLVIGVDSFGGVGEKPRDLLKASPYLVGRFIVRVPLIEVLVSGATVRALTSGVMNEFNPTGMRVLEGIKDELTEAGIYDVIINGSSEENFDPVSTGVAVTLVGLCRKSDFRLGRNLSGCHIGVAGIPKVKDEIRLPFDPEILSYATLQSLMAHPGVVEILPVGSQGILGELAQIEFPVAIHEKVAFDLEKSAGPATCALVFYQGEAPQGVVEIGRVGQ